MNYVKIVNHGNVFGSGNWFTFYCPKCGNQVLNNSDTCESTKTFPFIKGCGIKLNWNNKE